MNFRTMTDQMLEQAFDQAARLTFPATSGHRPEDLFDRMKAVLRADQAGQRSVADQVRAGSLVFLYPSSPDAIALPAMIKEG